MRAEGTLYREGYGRCLKSKGVEMGENNNVEQIWEQVKQTVVDSTRDGSVRVREKTQRM